MAYVNLHDPIRGKDILSSIASPSVQQLATEITKVSMMFLICSRFDMIIQI